MRYFLIFFLLLCFFVCKAQTGHYFLSHFSPGDERVDHVSFDMEQDANGILHFATRSGVLTYDGKNWGLISCNGPVYALELNQSGELYWAGADGFGQIIRDKYGRYISIVQSNPDKRDIYQALALGNKVYFMNEGGVFIYENQSARTINTHNVPGSFTSLFEMFGVAYVATDLGRIFKIDEVKLSDPAFEFEEGLDITFSCGSKDKFILGTADNKLFLCTKDYSIEEIELEESDYINASVIVNGVSLSNNLIALGTLRGGVIILNPETRSIEEIVNYNTGLPDNEIFALLLDKDKNIWASHDYGFTKISPLSPFRSFSHYDNLNGNLLCALSVNDDVYVGTSLGLFKLIKEEVYDEIIYYEDVPIKRATLPDKAKTNVSPIDSEATTTVATEEPEKRKKGFLRFLKRNRTESEEKVEAKESPAKKNNNASLDFKPQLPKEEYAVQRLRKTQKVLRSSNFAYKKVKGIEAKVTQLAIANNKLLAAGLGGLFEINNLSANAILEEPVRFVFTSGDTMMLVSTYRDKILTLKKSGSRWRAESEESNPDDQISNIFQGPAGELWLCGMNTIYQLENNGNIFSSFEFINPNFSKTIGLQWKNEIILVNTNGFFRLDANGNSIVKIDSLPAPRTYFTSNNELWYNDGNNWNTLGQFDKRKNIHLLNLCGDIRFVSPDNNSENLWIINANNELYKFLGNDVSYTPSDFPLVLKTVSQNSQPIAFGRKVIVNQDNGLIEIELARANFAGALPVECRYMLKGINEDWSDWSARNDRISFSYLPQGSYTLRIQSRDIFGTIKEVEPIQLLVRPPYWKTPWFYAMEFTVFALLVLFSFKLSVRYRFISRVLSLLTIILLIEFIQTMIGFSFATNSTPVIDFIIQVIVALIILPVEGYLRNLMFKSMGANSRLIDVIAELDRNEKSRK